jgi:phospholipid-binding lipoprotein MlaA
VLAGAAFFGHGAAAQTPAPTTAAPADIQAASATSPDDPYERLNRQLYASHNGLDQTFLLPLARVYRALTPGLIGKAIHNMVQNLSEPVVIGNDILQGRVFDTAQETWRLIANSTVGIGGMIDVATPAGAPRRDNDFGITLGRLGAPPGPYLFVPLVGPTTVRDLAGQVVDGFMNPLNYIRFPGRTTLLVTSTVVGGLDLRISSESNLQAILSDAADPYATLRSVYLQNRAAQVEGEPGTPVLPNLDDEPTATPSDAAPAAPSDATPAATPAPTAPDPQSAPASPSAPAAAPTAAPGPSSSLTLPEDEAAMEPMLDDPTAPAAIGLAAATQTTNGG